MGEYYRWVNVDKKEYLCPSDFDYGSKLHESMHKGNAVLCALRELLSTDWKNDRVLFLGDECVAPEDNTAKELFDAIQKNTDNPEAYGYLDEIVFDKFRDVSCIFRETEKYIREGIENFLEAVKSGDASPENEYGFTIDDPYNGMFVRTGKDYKYTLNYNKKVAYSFEETKITFINRPWLENADPLPLLLGYGRMTDPGLWLGDIIGVSDTLPPDYILLPEIVVE
ncbi:MAG: hypothetical protein J6X60_01920 [Ruminiclostridium sp.]|nr:hypothetical protein [Ruminiclostridium sp.]